VLNIGGAVKSNFIWSNERRNNFVLFRVDHKENIVKVMCLLIAKENM